ncbi:GntR family transcriptional regulator [Cohnella silvisoli]|uniref:GntR family transcriptional regulator n=1 Tax=Cohnella silvisoli TaxID=2873699 RepID=A0ABV1KW80_9BACL|nr:GntR family transcriptional regulator [Cohnella silvisoli]MCD9023633.1 GntR family transcriptional regulator [Cohnella silvisoli]
MISNISSGKKSLSETAYDWLRDSIIYLRFEPGQMVYENELAQTLGMSRTPLREAFRMLLMEGMIEILPQRGVRVSLISRSKAEEVRFIRESLEVSAVREVCRLWKEDGIRFSKIAKSVDALLEEQHQAAEERDALAFLQADEAFHQLILRQFGNETLLSVVLLMRGHLNRLRYLMLKEFEQMDVLIDEHRKLFEAVATGDEQAAVSQLESHLRKLHVELPEAVAKFPHYFTK